MNQEIVNGGRIETTHTAGPRLHAIEIVAAVLVFLILALTFTLLTDSIKIGFVLASFFCMLIGTVIGVAILTRSLQRHDQNVGRSDLATDTAPVIQAYLDSLQEQAREQRQMIRELMDERSANAKQTTRALPAPSVPVVDYQDEVAQPVPLVDPEPRSEPDYFGPAGLRIRNMHDTPDAVWFAGDDAASGGQWGGWFSVDLLQHFFETQWPEIGRVGKEGRKWERDDAAYGWTANLLTLLTALVPVGRSWKWHENVKHSVWLDWVNGLPKTERRIG